MGFESLACAADGASGAYAGYEEVNLTLGIAPNLFTCGAAVNGGVGGVIELLQYELTGDGLVQLLGLGDSALHALCAIGQHQLGT